MSKPSSWQERAEKLNRKNKLKLLYENLGKMVLEKGYLKVDAGEDPLIQEILRDIEKLKR